MDRGAGSPAPESESPEVHSITDAAAAHSEDMRERMIKYAVAMGIRMVCIILIFVVDGWFKLVAVAGAVFLPWIAVVIANGSDKAEIHSDALLDYVPAAEIESTDRMQESGTQSATQEEAESEQPMTILEGEIVDEPGTPEDNRGQAAS
ncbi:Protein of unknown function [Arthrobacter cupressi]|uniref:DUF3099 domain-containing protein n=1 Tax=Arthrobacter cupressi TaxID=1045773 RepID=A0A1G8TAT1_9MICC|nr:DUF3099 domain-containing protein [Arthrobacter cupressi]SDJ38015.1 Protein of unknown function [Arthrobacter cupressi]